MLGEGYQIKTKHKACIKSWRAADRRLPEILPSPNFQPQYKKSLQAHVPFVLNYSSYSPTIQYHHLRIRFAFVVVESPRGCVINPNQSKETTRVEDKAVQIL